MTKTHVLAAAIPVFTLNMFLPHPIVIHASLLVDNLALTIQITIPFTHLFFSVLAGEAHLLVNNELSSQGVTSKSDGNTNDNSY